MWTARRKRKISFRSIDKKECKVHLLSEFNLSCRLQMFYLLKELQEKVRLPHFGHCLDVGASDFVDEVRSYVKYMSRCAAVIPAICCAGGQRGPASICCCTLVRNFCAGTYYNQSIFHLVSGINMYCTV